MNKETELKPCREAFEEWAKLGSDPYDITKLMGDVYVCPATRNACFGW